MRSEEGGFDSGGVGGSRCWLTGFQIRVVVIDFQVTGNMRNGIFLGCNSSSRCKHGMRSNMLKRRRRLRKRKLTTDKMSTGQVRGKMVATSPKRIDHEGCI